MRRPGPLDFIDGFQQPLVQQPMSISIFGGGMPGGGIANFLQPLSNYLRNQVSQEQIDPFIQEVTQMAQERFNLQGGGLQSLPAVGLRGGPSIAEPIMPAVPFRFNANQISPASLVVPSESKLEPAVGAFPAFPTLG